MDWRTAPSFFRILAPGFSNSFAGAAPSTESVLYGIYGVTAAPTNESAHP